MSRFVGVVAVVTLGTQVGNAQGFKEYAGLDAVTDREGLPLSCRSPTR